MQGIRYQYSALYTDFAEQPELTRFRRYAKETAWMLYNQNAAIKILIEECNADIQKIQGLEGGATVFTVTDLHLALMCKEYPELSIKVDELTKKIRRYSEYLSLNLHPLLHLCPLLPCFPISCVRLANSTDYPQ
jgi:hypothetical protein